LLETHIEELLEGTYITTLPSGEGNVNYKADFDRLCSLDLQQEGTFGEFLDILRATTFDKYDNAFFFNEKGEKVYVRAVFKVEKIEEK